MRKLQQALKRLIKNGRSSASLTAEGSASASAFPLRPSSSAASAASAAETHPLSRLVLDPFRSWRSGSRIPSGSSAVLGLRAISNQVMARSHLRIGLQGLLDRGANSLKISLQRKSFDAGRFFSSPRSFSSYVLTPDGLVFSLIGANVAVYILWRIADPTFMRKHFMISLDNVKSGRLHTLLTSAFSHSDTDHLVTNMIGLYFFGTSIARLFGPKFLLNLYIAGALSGSLFYLVHMALTARSFKGKQGWDYSRIPALGASAAVNSIILLNVFLFPKNIYYVNLIIPVPAMLMGAILIGTDLWRIKKGDERISGSAHLGGAVVAALVFGRIKGWI